MGVLFYNSLMKIKAWKSNYIRCLLQNLIAYAWLIA